jgi:hypothetical protein
LHLSVSIRLIVDGAVYMIAAREAMILVRRLRRRSRGDDFGGAASAAMVLEWALATDRPRAVSFTPHEAEAIFRVAPDPGRIPYRALGRLGRSGS